MYIFGRKYGIGELMEDAVGQLDWCAEVAGNLTVEKELEVDDELAGEFDIEDYVGRKSFVSAKTIRRACEYTGARSLVRKWLVKNFAEFFVFDRENIGMLPRDYMKEVLDSYASMHDEIGNVEDRSEGGD